MGGAPLPYESRSLGYPRCRTNGGAPHSRTKCAPWGTPAVGQTGGTPLPYEMRSLGYPRSRKNGERALSESIWLYVAVCMNRDISPR